MAHKLPSRSNSPTYVLGLDVSSSVIGIALFEDKGDHGDLKLIHHIKPVVKPKTNDKIKELFEKTKIFREEFLKDYVDYGITRVIIEEPLLRSININTVATLLKFNGMISKDVYELLGVVPEYISSYDARKFSYPVLMALRTHNKKGKPYTEKEIAKGKPVLFGAYPWDIDKKEIIFEHVSKEFPDIKWIMNNKNNLAQENYDRSDAVAVALGGMAKSGDWKR
jgi:Holliday junction resolvasome RuvABC endonuclease subunit